MDQRNYTEDQSNEIEALDSIYCGDMESMCVCFLLENLYNLKRLLMK